MFMKRATTGRILKIGLLISLISATVCTSLYACMSMNGYTSTVDLSKVDLVQLEEPEPEDPVAVIRTSMGDISVRLFPEEAPNAVKNFEELANAGFYDDTYVFQLNPRYISLPAARPRTESWGKPTRRSMNPSNGRSPTICGPSGGHCAH